ncbi:MAG: T9SS type A sorting domain-containing protein [Bacteroidota bacterium]
MFGYPSVYVAPIAWGTPKKPSEIVAAAAGLELSQNYPNPFNPSTSISYNINNPGHVTLKVFNVVGLEVATLVNGVHSAGSHSIDFDASRLSGGMYVYRLSAGDESISKRMMLVK